MGSIKSFFSKKAESLKSTILGKKKVSVKSAGPNLISKVKSKLESLKSKEPVKSVKSAITKLFRRKRKTSDSSDRDENADSSDRGNNMIKIQETNWAFKGFAKKYTIEGWEGIDPESFLTKVKPQVIALLSRNRTIKVILDLTCVMERVEIKTGEVITTNVPFRSKTEIILEATDVNEFYKNAVDKIKESIAKFQMQGSNWRFRRVVKLDINTVVYKPLNGDSYIDLPQKLKKRAIINMKNDDDDQCFKWSVTRARNPVRKDPQRITPDLRKQAEKLNWNNINFPASFKDIKTFEENNDGIKINVFGYEKGKIYPIRHTKDEKAIDLLFISNEITNHYCWIKNFNRLLARNGNTMHCCKRCMDVFSSLQALEKHKTYCYQQGAVRRELPKPGTMLGFGPVNPNDDYTRQIQGQLNKSMQVPFVIYADFESCIQSIDTCQPSSKESYMNKILKHKPLSFCIVIKWIDDIVPLKTITYTAKSDDEDVGQIFVETLERNVKRIYKIQQERKKIQVYIERRQKKI